MVLVLSFWVLSYLLFKDLSYPKRTIQKGEEVSHWYLDIGEAGWGQVFLSNTGRFCVLVLFCYFFCLFLLLSLDFHCWWAGFLIRLVLTADAGGGEDLLGRTGPALCLGVGHKSVIITIVITTTFI